MFEGAYDGKVSSRHGVRVNGKDFGCAKTVQPSYK